MTKVGDFLNAFPQSINDKIIEVFSDEESPIKDIIMYSICRGGKRVRPAIISMLLSSYSKQDAWNESAQNLAIAVELVHIYSLILDDLPSMDNDDVRYEMPTVHRRFSEGKAIMCADMILMQALEIVSKTNKSFIKDFNNAIKRLIRGQFMDISDNTVESPESLHKLCCLKTGALFELCVKVVSRHLHDTKESKKLEGVGEIFGVLFQLIDDISDNNTSKTHITLLKEQYKRFLLHIESVHCKKQLNDTLNYIAAINNIDVNEYK